MNDEMIKALQGDGERWMLGEATIYAGQRDIAHPRPVERPKGNNADEWALWFFEYAGYGAQYLGVQIAEAIDQHVERTALLDRAQAVRILITDKDHGVCVGGRWDGWLMWKHPDGQCLGADRRQ
jgi:hypothetical protein